MGKKSRSKRAVTVSEGPEPKKPNWGKTFTVFSLSIVLLATVGFSIVGFQNQKINKEREKLAEAEMVAQNAFYDLKDTVKEYDKAMLMRNHIDVLSTIKADSTLVGERKNEQVNILKTAVFGAYAIAVKLPDINIQKQWNDLASYEELFPIYMKYLLQAEKRIKDAQRKNSSEIQRIEGIEGAIKNWHILLVVLNSVGLVFGVISSFLSTKKAGG